MKTFSEIQRNKTEQAGINTEKTLRTYTASYDAGCVAFPSWRLGNLHLTEQHLFFVQVQKVIFRIPVDRIAQIKLVKRRWILGKRVLQLHIQWNANGFKRRVFIAVKEPQVWKKEIEIQKAISEKNDKLNV